MSDSTLKITFSFLLLFALFSARANGADTQSKVWLFDAADNSGELIKITEGDYGVADVYFWAKSKNTWQKSSILSIDINQEYIKVKSADGLVYELYVDWNDDKVVLVDADKNKTAYWHRKS